RAIASGESFLTPAARAAISLRPGGGSVQSILTQLVEGRLVFLLPRTPRPLRSTALARREPMAPPAPPLVVRDEKVAWIKLRVVADQTGEPLPGVALRVTQPNRKTFDYKTRPDGAVEVHGIDPGFCDVASNLDGALRSDTYAFVTMGDQPSALPP